MKSNGFDDLMEIIVTAVDMGNFNSKRFVFQIFVIENK